MIQTIKKNWVYLLFAVAVITFIISKANRDEKAVSYKAIVVTNGWGYEIYKKNKLFIKQETIPAAEGYKVFVNEHEAALVAALVVQKIEKGKTDFPSITIKELDSLHITR
jgi:hypothetical protein